MNSPEGTCAEQESSQIVEGVPHTCSHREFRNIALVGFMGTGKSTVGALLADLLGFQLIDTDRTIEQREKRRVSEIFASQGEAHFRGLEANLVSELSDTADSVISCGGGTILSPDNLQKLRHHALIACLWAAPETIFERVKNQGHRPLLQAPNPLERIRQLLAERAPVYRAASDLMVGVDYRHAPEIARHIAKSFADLRRARSQSAEAASRPESVSRQLAQDIRPSIKPPCHG